MVKWLNGKVVSRRRILADRDSGHENANGGLFRRMLGRRFWKK